MTEFPIILTIQVAKVYNKAMEALNRIINDIKINKEIARERREEKKKKEGLRKFFDSPAGKTYLESIQSKWNIGEIKKKEVIAIDNEYNQFRLAIDVGNETLRNIIHERKPELITYRVTHFDDQMDAGDVLIEIDDKAAIQTSGIIFTQSSTGKRGILEDLPQSYARQIENYSKHFQPWQKLALKKST